MDKEGIREERDRKIARLLKYFGLIMAIFYLMAGVTVLVLPVFASVGAYTRYLLAAMLFIYGLVRLYRQLRRKE